ncbi:3-demethylubiquinone-9 3-methyltransferase [compost metagenome]
MQINCETQAQIDHYWDKLSAGGPPEAQQCGWLKDRFGLSWQVVPANLADMVAGSDSEKSQRVMTVLLGMKKLDIQSLERAYAGE